MSIIKLPLLAFNDVYRVHQKYTPPTDHTADPNPNHPPPKGQEYIHFAQFGKTLLDIRDSWEKREGEEDGREGLVLFAGDVFNPSVESSVTRGSHMVPLLNALNLTTACLGNHDFDFGYPHLLTLIGACNFPWLLSNIVDEKTGVQPGGVGRFWVGERGGLRIGVVGLVEKDWIATIPSWPENFKHQDMATTALSLSAELRDPNGPHKVDLIIALTHCRLPNDIDLANRLGAVKGDVKGEHGVDLLIGGHDHIYYIGKGADSWEWYERNKTARGTEKDQGVRLIKSGTDFRDLSEAMLELEKQEEGSLRRYLIKSLTGKHHQITPQTPTSQPLKHLTDSLLSTVSSALSAPVCFTLTPWDVRSELVRTEESAVGNWVADVLLHSYAEMLEEMRGEGEQGEGRVGIEKEGAVRAEGGRADCVIICGGTLRGDSQYGPGPITLGDILEIMPFDDPVVCLEIDGAGIWDVLESALSKWPAQEGRFPIISGLQVVWDHLRPPNQRVISIHLLAPYLVLDADDDQEDIVDFVEQPDGTRIEVKQKVRMTGEEVKREKGGRIYRVITRNYMAEGYDGFDGLKDRNFIVDDDNGQIMSSIMRTFLLGSSFIFRHKQLREQHEKHLSAHTEKVLAKARSRFSSVGSPSSSPVASPAKIISTWPRSPSKSGNEVAGLYGMGGSTHSLGNGRHVVDHSWQQIRDAMHVARHDHMSDVDGCDGATLRGQTPQKPSPSTPGKPAEPIKIGASYVVDSRSRDELKTQDSDLAIVSPLVDGRLKDVSAGKH